jgi:catechol 2,3-dioxygenase-like lactoylglutathione lyase family enzyme
MPETAIHTDDMARSRAFYEGVIGLEPISAGYLLMHWRIVMSCWSTQQRVVLPVSFLYGKDVRLWPERTCAHPHDHRIVFESE